MFRLSISNINIAKEDNSVVVEFGFCTLKIKISQAVNLAECTKLQLLSQETLVLWFNSEEDYANIPLAVFGESRPCNIQLRRVGNKYYLHGGMAVIETKTSIEEVVTTLYNMYYKEGEFIWTIEQVF